MGPLAAPALFTRTSTPPTLSSTRRPSSWTPSSERRSAAAPATLASRCSLNFSTGRTALEDFELEGQEIKAGDVVMVSLLAVNRDPQRFEAPDELRFDDRAQNAHLAFGHGIHRCIGAPLAAWRR